LLFFDTAGPPSLRGAGELVDDQPCQVFVPPHEQLFDPVGPRQKGDADLRAGRVQVEPAVETKRIQASGRLDLRVAA